MHTMRKDGEAVYIIGASRSGKTQYALARLTQGKYKRLLVWDFGGLWFSAFKNLGIEVELVKGAAALIARLQNDKSQGILCYEPDTFAKDRAKEFQLFCGVAFLWVKQSPACIVVEEAATVLSSGQATGEWQVIQTQMQKYGGAIFCIIQRGQEGDKTTMTQATELVLFRVEERDKEYLIHNIGVSTVPDQDLCYLKRDKRKNETIGRIDFGGQNDPRKYKLIEKTIEKTQNIQS